MAGREGSLIAGVNRGAGHNDTCPSSVSPPSSVRERPTSLRSSVVAWAQADLGSGASACVSPGAWDCRPSACTAATTMPSTPLSWWCVCQGALNWSNTNSNRTSQRASPCAALAVEASKAIWEPERDGRMGLKRQENASRMIAAQTRAPHWAPAAVTSAGACRRCCSRPQPLQPATMIVKPSSATAAPTQSVSDSRTPSTTRSHTRAVATYTPP